MGHTLETAPAQIERLRALRADSPRAGAPMQICLGGPVTSRDDVARWEDLGVTRLLVSPWRRSPEAVEALHRFADLAL
jgi:hypothetical protein